MTVNSLSNQTTATQIHKNPIAVRFFEFLDSSATELIQTGKLSSSTIEKILGKQPVIPSSPDMDARLEAYEELTRYSEMISNIESKIRTYAKTKKGS